MSDLARQSFQRGLIPEEALSNIRAVSARIEKASEPLRASAAHISATMASLQLRFQELAARIEIHQRRGGRPNHYRRHVVMGQLALELIEKGEAKGPFAAASRLVKEFGYTTNEADYKAAGGAKVWGNSARAARDSLVRYMEDELLD